ncbi:hypothetical protein K503DRAFT_783900 [Rhizopogon vinicolor AM-OR11-026]|uniref:Uncharacterized protein n=1 Tax=Rhizopogon vinicolor AM-OR11-026 TaxID=1314800 RepID=A0A1B7MWT2_9AGAM|nr:hypothetical protein K503DRAFT_783900 [Rhizopogon vinicolor AM-OR11-026]
MDVNVVSVSVAVTATIFHFIRTAAIFCMGVVFLHLAHREPEIKFYAFYAGTFAIVMSFFNLFCGPNIYRRALATGNEAAKSQASEETVPETTGTEGTWEYEKRQGVSKTAGLLV